MIQSVFVRVTALVLLTLANAQISVAASAAKDTKADTPFAVGVKTLFIHDVSRPYDSLGGVNIGVRSLLTEVWYPVDHADLAPKVGSDSSPYPQATFGDYVFGRRDIHKKMMTQTTFFHLTPQTVRDNVTQEQMDAAMAELFERPRNAYREAPLAQTNNPFPIVVMTHGDAGSRYNMETACEALAAQGYVVIAPEHTGNTPFALTGEDPTLQEGFDNAELAEKMAPVKAVLNADGTYGPVKNYGQTYTPLASSDETGMAFIELDKSLVERVNDLRAALLTLGQWNTKGEFAGRLDMDRIGVMGRSFGGMTTLAALGLEDRFVAGVAVVPLVFPDFRPALPKEALIGDEGETVLLDREGDITLNTVHKPTLYLSGAEDALIIGSGVRMAKNFGGPEPSQSNPHAVLRASYESTDLPVYWGLLNNSNHSSFGISGGYWWPELKPDSQTRTFAPDEDFTLIAPILAHEIQQERVVTFFDAYLKEQSAAMQRLKENPFSDKGFEYEYRNVGK